MFSLLLIENWLSEQARFSVIRVGQKVKRPYMYRVNDYRAVATFQKDVETHLNGGHNLPPLVGIGLTDLPKRCGDVSPASL